MNEHNNQLTRIHNTVLMILTIASIAVITESVIQGWEFWVPPLIALTILAGWAAHVTQYREPLVRENYYLIFGMILMFYHGVHQSSIYDMVAISAVLMSVAALLGKREFLAGILVEFFVILAVQVALQNRYRELTFTTVDIARIFFHIACEIGCYILLVSVIGTETETRKMTEDRKEENRLLRSRIDDFLLNMSDELKSTENTGAVQSRRVEDIGEFSRLRRNFLEAENTEYSITQLTDGLASGTDKMKKQGVELVVDLDPAIPAVLSGDAQKIARLTEHLLDNSFRYTRCGGVYLHISGVKHQDSFNLMIEVKDTGIGMSTDLIEEISNGTYVRSSEEHKEGGLGIGLAIVYGYAHLMNGFVNIDSEPGKGTCVRVSIPQEIVSSRPCMELDKNVFLNVIFHLDPRLYKDSRVPGFYKTMTDNLATGLRFNLYYASTVKEVMRLTGRGGITHVIVGDKELAADTGGLKELPYEPQRLPRPAYTHSVVTILNGRAVTSSAEGGRG